MLFRSIKGATGKSMSEEQQKGLLFSLNYSNMLNDRQKALSEEKSTVEELTMFKEVSINPMSDAPYMNDYEMKDECSNVFKEYSKLQQDNKINKDKVKKEEESIDHCPKKANKDCGKLLEDEKHPILNDGKKDKNESMEESNKDQGKIGRASCRERVSSPV